MTQPPPLNYASQPPPNDSRDAGGRFMVGLAGGVLVSTVVWLAAWKVWDHLFSLWTIGLIVGGKVAVATVMIAASRRTRSAGVGILVSIALGALIFGWSFVNALCGK